VQKQPVSRRFFTWYHGTIATLVVAAAVYGCYRVRSFYVEQMAADLDIRARLCARQLAEPVQQKEYAAVDILCKDLGRLMDTRVTVILRSGKVVGDTNEDPARMEDHSNRPEIRAAMVAGAGRATHFSRTLHEDRMYVAVAIDSNSAPEAFVRMSIPTPAINKTLAALYYDFLVAGLIVAVFAPGVSLWISLDLSRSLDVALADPWKVAKKDLEGRFSDLKPEEIDDVIASMDAAAEQKVEHIRAARPADRNAD